MLGAITDYLLRVLQLCRKELLAILKDPASRVILVAPAIMQSLIFGYAATYDLQRVDYALLDQSHGAAARELVARLEGGGVFRRAMTLRSPADIAAPVDRQKRPSSTLSEVKASTPLSRMGKKQTRKTMMTLGKSPNPSHEMKSGANAILGTISRLTKKG